LVAAKEVAPPPECAAVADSARFVWEIPTNGKNKRTAIIAISGNANKHPDLKLLVIK
jgi:hypothetical protein